MATDYDKGKLTDREKQAASSQHDLVEYNKETTNNIADFNKNSANQLADFNEGTARNVAKFNENTANSLADYNKGNATTLRKYNTATANDTAKYNQATQNNLAKYNKNAAKKISNYSENVQTKASKQNANRTTTIAGWNAKSVKDQVKQQIKNYNFANRQNASLRDVQLKQNSRKTEAERFEAQRNLQNAALGLLGSMNQAMNGSTIGNTMYMLNNRNDADNSTYWQQLADNRNAVLNAYDESYNQNQVAKLDAITNARKAVRDIQGDLSSNLNNIQTDLNTNLGNIRSDLLSNLSNIDSDKYLALRNNESDRYTNIRGVNSDWFNNVTGAEGDRFSNINSTRADRYSNVNNIRGELFNNLNTIEGDRYTGLRNINADLAANLNNINPNLYETPWDVANGQSVNPNSKKGKRINNGKVSINDIIGMSQLPNVGSLDEIASLFNYWDSSTLPTLADYAGLTNNGTTLSTLDEIASLFNDGLVDYAGSTINGSRIPAMNEIASLLNNGIGTQSLGTQSLGTQSSNRNQSLGTQSNNVSSKGNNLTSAILNNYNIPDNVNLNNDITIDQFEIPSNIRTISELENGSIYKAPNQNKALNNIYNYINGINVAENRSKLDDYIMPANAEQNVRGNRNKLQGGDYYSQLINGFN